MSQPKVIAIMGATATGKTALAIELAQQLGGEIISVDSALVYRHMDIGTAKPSLKERAGVVHHLIDIKEPYQSYSAADFRQDALDLIHQIHARGKLPILCGGTFLYFRALFLGLAALPAADKNLRAKYQKIIDADGSAALYALLAKSDPVAAARLHQNDPQRIMRALEVISTTGLGIDQHHRQQAKQQLPFALCKIALAPASRPQHRQQLKNRLDKMLAAGFLDEARQLYERDDFDAELPAMRAVAYRQAWQYFDGTLDYPQFCERALIATAQLAKRQQTWLNKEQDALTLNCQSADYAAKAHAHCVEFLSAKSDASAPNSAFCDQ